MPSTISRMVTLQPIPCGFCIMIGCAKRDLLTRLCTSVAESESGILLPALLSRHVKTPGGRDMCGFVRLKRNCFFLSHDGRRSARDMRKPANGYRQTRRGICCWPFCIELSPCGMNDRVDSCCMIRTMLQDALFVILRHNLLHQMMIF